jgi:hypothetical protein
MAGYEVNRDYIAKNLCENRNKPQMHCNGKCHLNKELKEQQKKEQNPLSSIIIKYLAIQYFQSQYEFSFTHFSTTVKNNFYYSQTSLPKISFSIFHPPIC